jgi:hypothetical protein
VAATKQQQQQRPLPQQQQQQQWQQQQQQYQQFDARRRQGHLVARAGPQSVPQDLPLGAALWISFTVIGINCKQCWQMTVM